MEIPYASRSKFLDACEAAIRQGRSKLDAGETVRVVLKKGGYDGCIVVTIRQDDRAAFEADWSSSDPSRFPARIKAAATALLNCGCEGCFEVTHTDGSLVIRGK